MNDMLEQASILTGYIGSPGFDHALLNFAAVFLPVNKCTAYYYPTNGAPTCISAAGRNARYEAIARALSKHYIAEGFADDPNLGFLELPIDGQVHATLIDPREIAEGRFRKRYYEVPGITQEVAFLLGRSDGAYYLSLFRGAEHIRLQSTQLDALAQGGKLMLATIVKHAEVTGMSQGSGIPRLPDPTSMDGLIDVMLQCPGRLSRREAEVCAHILLGYSTLAMSINLDIAVNTIATHRKRAYGKMKLSSQSELFCLVIDRMHRRARE